MSHLVILPVLLPLAVSAMLLPFGREYHRAKRIAGVATTAGLLAIAILLLVQMQPDAAGVAAPIPYFAGGWPAPFGIVLVADQLSVLMVLLASLVGFAGLLYAGARWGRADPRFHTLFLLLLAGVNGAFLAGDIFNLFVFFELLLAASYGLALYGGGTERTRVNLHYITINIAASMLFLIGIALLYNVTGTLNMAELALRIPEIPPGNRILFELGIAMLGIAFLVKSAAWPLGFWLTATYAAAVPPVAAIFAIMTKVGIYIILRLTSLFLGGTDGIASMGGKVLVLIGLATIAFGMLNILSTRKLNRVAGYYLMVSSGTLIGAIGFGGAALNAALLYYLVSSTLSVSALYLLTEMVRREVYGDGPAEVSEPVFRDEDIYAVAEKEDETGMAIPGTIALLGGGFILCTLLLSGLPPLSGFIGKFALIDALLRAPMRAEGWAYIALIMLAGLATLVSLTRAGIELLWVPSEDAPKRLQLTEVVPVGLLLAACTGLVVFAGPVYAYLDSVAELVAHPATYVAAVKGGVAFS